MVVKTDVCAISEIRCVSAGAGSRPLARKLLFCVCRAMAAAEAHAIASSL
jgi:hypothetical protein